MKNFEYVKELEEGKDLIYHLGVIKELCRSKFKKEKIKLNFYVSKNPGLYLYVINNVYKKDDIYYILHDFGRRILYIGTEKPD